MTEAAILVGAAPVVSVAMGIAYLRVVRLPRPPIGRLDLSDVAFLMALIVVMPYLYLAAPRWLVCTLLGAGAASALLLAAEPLIDRGAAADVRRRRGPRRRA